MANLLKNMREKYCGKEIFCIFASPKCALRRGKEMKINKLKDKKTL